MPGPDFARQADVVDAEFISIGPVSVADRAVALVPAPSFAALPDDLTMLSRDATPALARASGGPMFWAGGVVVAFAAFWVAGGHTLLDAEATTGDGATGLRIASVISRVDRSGTKPILLVDGKAVNDSGAAVSMPPLQIQIVTAEGGSTLYKLGTAGRSLAGGDIFDFSSRLDLPKDGVRTVFVTFAQ